MHIKLIILFLFISSVLGDSNTPKSNTPKSITPKSITPNSIIYNSNIGKNKSLDLVNKKNCNLNCNYDNTKLVEFKLEEYTKNPNKFKYVFNTTKLDDNKLSIYLNNYTCSFYCNNSKHIAYYYNNSYYSIKKLDFNNSIIFIGICKSLFLGASISNYDCFETFINNTLNDIYQIYTTDCTTLNCNNIFNNTTLNNISNFSTTIISFGNTVGNSKSDSSSDNNIEIITISGILFLMGIAIFVVNKRRRRNTKNKSNPLKDNMTENKSTQNFEIQEYHNYQAPTPINSESQDYLEPNIPIYNTPKEVGSSFYEKITDRLNQDFSKEEETSCDNVYDMGNNNSVEETPSYDIASDKVEDSLYDYADNNLQEQDYEIASNSNSNINEYLKVMPNDDKITKSKI